MEEYLDNCLSSMIMDDASLMGALEVIIVNDGSKDRSLEIASSYKERFPDTFIVIDKENGNYGSCVNMGLKEATGNYFRIVDADDWVDTSALITFISHLIDCNCDLVFTNYAVIKGLNIEYKKCNARIIPNVVYDLTKIVYEKDDYHMQMHGMTYKTDVLKSMGLRLTEGVSYTDSEYCFLPLSAIETIIYWDIVLYQYRAEREGQTISVESRVKSTNSMHMVALSLLSNFIDCDNCARSNMQLDILKRVLWMYYLTSLGLCKKDKNLNNRLLEFHEKLKNYPKLVAYTRRLKIRRIPYVSVWENTGLYNSSFIFRIYNCIYDLLKNISAI